MKKNLKSIGAICSITGSIIILVLFLFGCGGKEEPVAPVDPGVIMPLKVGNTWVYEWYDYVEGDTTPTDSEQAIVEIIDTSTYASRLRYVARTIYADRVPPDTMLCYYDNRPDGLYWTYNVDDTSWLKIKYPSDVGLYFTSAWGYFVYPHDLYIDMVVAGTNTAITTLAGSFSCYDYRINPGYPYQSIHDYYCTNVGRIKILWREYNQDTGTWFTAFKCELRERTIL